ncbi:MAG: sigma 54-interacting transcriptional regulator [Flavobacteriaceae bacterium]
MKKPIQVAPTDISVLVTRKAVWGKKISQNHSFPFSTENHNKHIAVNCGAHSRRGTIDSELLATKKAAYGANTPKAGILKYRYGGLLWTK